jgi:hypothetical protein
MCLGLVDSPPVQSAVPYQAEFASVIRHIAEAAIIVVDAVSRPPGHMAVKLVGPPPAVACVKAPFRSHVAAQQGGKLKSSTSTPHGVAAGVAEVQILPRSPSARWWHPAGQ